MISEQQKALYSEGFPFGAIFILLSLLRFFVVGGTGFEPATSTV
jgi:hypothetical protein